MPEQPDDQPDHPGERQADHGTAEEQGRDKPIETRYAHHFSASKSMPLNLGSTSTG